MPIGSTTVIARVIYLDKISKKYYAFVTNFIIENRCKIIVEIGVDRGRLTRLVLRSEAARFIEQYWAIDIWASSPDNMLNSDETWDKIYRGCCKYYPYFPALKIFKMRSVEAAAYFSKDFKGYFDFVFIDACHVYECVRDDIEAWYPLVKEGGWLTGHDYCLRELGVKRAVDEAFGDNIEVKHEVWIHGKKS